MKIPSAKIQAPEKFPGRNSKKPFDIFCLELEIWDFSGTWNLDFGA